VNAPSASWKEFDMTALARKIDAALDVLVPHRRLPDPANDNRFRADYAPYVRDARAQAGAAYQPVGAKMWWLP
jgi:hypothetical protein